MKNKPLMFTLDYDFGLELKFAKKLGEMTHNTINVAGVPLTFTTHTSKCERVIQIDLLSWLREQIERHK